MALQHPSRLYRSRSDKMIAGVCGGLGDYFDVDPVLIRLLFVATALISGIGLVAYVVLWIVVPRRGDEGLPREQVLRGEVGGLYREARERIDAVGASSVSTAGSEGADKSDDPAGEGEIVDTSEQSAAQDAAPVGHVPPVQDDRRRRRQHWAGVILIVLGLLFLGQSLGLLWWIQIQYVWPLVLIGVGGWLLFGRSRDG